MASTPTERAAPALIVGLVLLVYWNAFAGSFQYDDFNVIVDNPAVATLTAWWHSMPGMRPLLKLSYALNQSVWPGDLLFGFHAVNLALHAGNALLLFGIARSLCGDSAQAGRFALLTALLFALHPVHTEAVTMISGRSMSLMAFCYLASLFAHLNGRRLLSLVAFAAALATRETAMTLPLALLMVERLRKPDATLRQALRTTRDHWLLAALAAALLLMLPWFRHLAAVSLTTRPLGDNLISQSAAVLYLLKQAVWPFALNADPLLPAFHGWQPFWIVCVLLASGLLAAATWLWRQRGEARWAGFGLLWFLLHLAPTNSLLPRLDLANERHLYLADIGLCLIVARLLMLAACRALVVDSENRPRRVRFLPDSPPHSHPMGQEFGKKRAVAAGLQPTIPKPDRLPGTRPRLRAGIAIALLLGLAWLTHARNPVYRDEITFWRDVTAKSPANSRAHNNLGYALANAGQPAAALAAYDRALSLSPDDVTARLNRRALCRTLPACAEAPR